MGSGSSVHSSMKRRQDAIDARKIAKKAAKKKKKEELYKYLQENTDYQDKVRFLFQVPLLKRLPLDQQPLVARAAKSVKFPPRTVIIKEGEMGDDFYVLRQGEASVTVHTVKGDKVVGRLGPGDYFGEKALLASEPRTATITSESFAECLKIQRQHFEELGLKEKLTFADRKAERKPKIRRSKPPTPKTPQDKAFIRECLLNSENLNGGMSGLTEHKIQAITAAMWRERVVLRGAGDRIDRTLGQRLYLLHMQRHPEGPGADFKVLGSTGNVYTVDIGTRPSCDCPDFLKGRGLCKHILFIWLRVLGISEDDYRIWQRALVSSELRSAVEPLFKRRARRALPLARKEVQKAFQQATKQQDGDDEDQERRHRKELEGEDCPVCFEEMSQAEEAAGKLTFCCTCGNNFHHDCINRWQKASSGSCPLCREPWHPASKRVAPGDCLPVVRKLQRSDSFGGTYLNLQP